MSPPPPAPITGSGVPRAKVGLQYDGERPADYVSPDQRDQHGQLLHLLDVVLRACRDLEVISSELGILHEDRVAEDVEDVIKLLRSKRP